jgi:hypothetical protein
MLHVIRIIQLCMRILAVRPVCGAQLVCALYSGHHTRRNALEPAGVQYFTLCLAGLLTGGADLHFGHVTIRSRSVRMACNETRVDVSLIIHKAVQESLFSCMSSSLVYTACVPSRCSLLATSARTAVTRYKDSGGVK